MENQFSTPVLLNVFNRPKETRMLLEIIGKVQPKYLYVHCDGPRPGNEKDEKNVEEVHRVVEELVTWPCELNKLYEPMNLGCGKGPASSMTWFFSNVEEGIILEDDCHPHVDFFQYCQELLEKYRYNEKVGLIGGTTFLNDYDKTVSYHFTPYPEIWGWATWKRIWDKYEFNYQKSDVDFKRKVLPYVKSHQAIDFWTSIMHRCIADGDDKTYWDYQLALQLLYNNVLTIAPNTNMVSNVGFGEDASHTFDVRSIYANNPISPILPLSHPDVIEVDYQKVNRPYEVSLGKRIRRKIRKFVGPQTWKKIASIIHGQ